MMKRIVSVFLVSMIHLACASAVYSKGTPDKVVIKGGGLSQPIEITDRETLQGFDPYFALTSIAAHGRFLPARQLAPRQGLASVIKPHHLDAAGRGADQITEIAADAFILVNDGEAKTFNLREGNALVRAVFAGDVA